MKIAALLCFLYFAVFADAKPQELPPEAVKSILEKVKHAAITYGNGTKEIHSFIDPKCEMSRRYMQFVMKNKSMLQRYTYYFYLLELKRLDSAGYIGYILDSESPDKVLLSVMLEDYSSEEAQHYLPDEAAESQINEIIQAADKIGVYKWPYIIYNGKVK